MGASQWTNALRGARLRLPGVALLACAFLHPSHITSAAAAAVPLSPQPSPDAASRLVRRNDGEHVVLADCRDPAGVYSSQMAYFPGDPDPFPEDVAIVVTEPGQLALWVNTNTSGLFTATGVTFTASLGPRVPDGQYAGTGENGYGNFSCYQSYVHSLYRYEDTICSQVYVCDHSDPPETLPAESSGMSQGTIIGIAVGVSGGVLFIVAAGIVYWFFRRSRREKQDAGTALNTDSNTLSHGPASELGDHKSTADGQSQPFLQQEVHEADGRRCRVEMASDTGKYELDSSGHAELEATKHNLAAETIEEEKQPPATSPTETNVSKSVSPVSPDSPRSPPPQYSPPNP